MDAGPYLQPLDAIAHAGLERQGEEQRLADLRPRPHPRAAGAPGGRTLGKPRRSPAARPAAVARPARTPPAVGRARRRRVKAPRGAGAARVGRRGVPGVEPLANRGGGGLLGGKILLLPRPERVPNPKLGLSSANSGRPGHKPTLHLQTQPPAAEQGAPSNFRTPLERTVPRRGAV